MQIAKPVGLLVSFVVFASTAIAAESGVTCNGLNTILYSSSDMDLSVCHGEYTKIDKSKLERWQNCDDALIHIKDKKQGKTRVYADCMSETGKQIRVVGDTFMLRHFHAQYPGRFEPKPLLIEALNLSTNTKSYKFEKQFPACSKKDIDDATRKIDMTTAKPFDGSTYFNSVYGAFYKLRNCSVSDSQRVLSILHKYQESDRFDGEVAEMLSSVISEVELIHAATTNK